ncbi:MAG: TonB-dependent receptor [Rikenellaceae bacterium]
MKNFKHLVFVILAVASTASAMAASLKGKVIDKSTNEPLIGATVMVKGTTKGVTTDIDGSFVIDLDRKSQTLSIAYISYTTQEVAIEGKTKHEDMTIQLESDSQMIDAVKITAQINRESEFAAIADQKNSLFATQIVGVKELSRKGVGDAQGAVMKVSGISKQEGVKNVFVRGLGDRYNSTTLNGLPIPSEDPEYKNISLDFFSTDVIQSVNVNKAFYAPGTSDVGGANINITSKELTSDYKFDISVSAGFNTNVIGNDIKKADGVNSLGYANTTLPSTTTSGVTFENKLATEDKGGNFNKSVAMSGGKRFEFGEDQLNVYLVAAYDNSYDLLHEEAKESNSTGSVITEDFDVTTSEINTSLLGLANVNYSISNRHAIDYNFMYIHSNKQSVADFVGTFDRESDDNEGVRRRQQINDNTLMVNQLLTKWELTSRLKLNIAGSYNQIKGNEPDRRINTYLYSKTLNDGLLYVTSDEDSNERYFSTLNENDINGQASLEYKLFDDEDNKSSVKVGYNGRVVDNNFDAYLYMHKISGVAGAESVDQIDMDSYSSTFNVYNPTHNYYTIDRTINSMFADVTYEFGDKFTANLGLKYDMVNIIVEGVTANGSFDATIDKSYFLPSLNLHYSVNEKNALRLSASKTYTLPQSKEIAPYRYYGHNFVSEGDENLQPSQNYNLDLKWDWYLSNGELFSVTGFYKLIVDPISRIAGDSSIGALTYTNIAESATAAGLEIELRKNLYTKQVEGGQNKLSMGFNGSYIYTHADIYEELNPSASTSGQLEGAAPVIANLDATFLMSREKYELSATAVCNYTSDRIYTLGTRGFEDMVQKGYPTLDFVSSISFKESMKFSFKVSNLLDAERQITRAGSVQDVVLSSYKQGMDISLGFSYGF